MLSAETKVATVPKLATMPAGYYRGDDLMTPQEVADWLKVKPSWVAEQVKERAQIRSKNPLPHVRLGKYTRFSRMRIAEWLGEHST
jgi:hypothetical protein